MDEAMRTEISMRFSRNDWAIFCALKTRLGLESRSELFRLSLRALARENGIQFGEDGAPVETTTKQLKPKARKR
jgi:hypothetical protein